MLPPQDKYKEEGFTSMKTQEYPPPDPIYAFYNSKGSHTSTDFGLCCGATQTRTFLPWLVRPSSVSLSSLHMQVQALQA